MLYEVITHHGRMLRWLPLLAAALFAGVLLIHRDQLWHHELGALSPVSDAAQDLDASLRRDLPAPDVRFLVVSSAGDADTALAHAEALARTLAPLADRGLIGGFRNNFV